MPPRTRGPSRATTRAAQHGTQLIDLEVPVERAFLVAVDTGDGDGWSAEDSLGELANLAL